MPYILVDSEVFVLSLLRKFFSPFIQFSGQYNPGQFNSDHSPPPGQFNSGLVIIIYRQYLYHVVSIVET